MYGNEHLEWALIFQANYKISKQYLTSGQIINGQHFFSTQCCFILATFALAHQCFRGVLLVADPCCYLRPKEEARCVIHMNNLATTPLVYTNKVLVALSPDSIAGSAYSYDCRDIDGENGQVSLVSVAFFADFPVSSEVLSAMRRSTQAFCTHCSFCHRVEECKSKYCYTTKFISLA